MAFGRLVLPKKIAEKQPNYDHKMKAVDLVYPYLAKNQEKFKLKISDYEKHCNNSWYVYGVKLDQVIDQVVELVVEGHTLRDHSYRHGVEKHQRKLLFKEALEDVDIRKITID